MCDMYVLLGTLESLKSRHCCVEMLSQLYMQEF